MVFNSISKILLTVLILIGFVSIGISQSDQSYQPLKDVLKQIEGQNSVTFIYENGLIDQLETSFLYDSKSKLELQLRILFQYFRLEYKKISYNTYAIIRTSDEVRLFGRVTDEQGSPLVGATISIDERNKGTTTNLNGEYELFVHPEKLQLQARYVGCRNKILNIEPNSFIESNVNFTLKDLSPLEQIVVVGLKLRSTSLLKTAYATNVVQAKRIPHSASSEMGDLLQNSVPSFHSTQQMISDGTDHIDPSTLKGLGSDQILVLINGKRRHSSSLVNVNGTIGKGSVATDLNAIPLAAVEKVEVLRDGASTQYGSDAIAGVINIILKESVGVIDLNSSLGVSKYGDGETLLVNGNYGVNLGKKGSFINMTFDFKNRSSTDRSGNYSGIIFGDDRDQDKLAVESFYESINLEDRHVMSVGQSESINAGLFLNMKLPINYRFELYVFGGANYKLGKSGAFYRFPYQDLKQSGIHPLGFAPNINADIFDRSITVGSKGVMNDWKIDFSNSFGSNSFFFNVSNSNNASLGLASPSEAKAGGFKYTQNVINLDLQRKLEMVRPIELGFGVETRLENYTQSSGEDASWKLFDEVGPNGEAKEAGIQSFPGFRPENETNQYRLNFGMNADVDIEISEPLLVGVASRLEFYEDFGNNLSWKLYARYQLSSKTSIRSTVNTGFRAPSLPQVHFSTTSLQFISKGTEQVGAFVSHFNNSDPITRTFGIEPLKAESSVNYNIGLSSNFINNLSVSLDLYSIMIKDRIVTTGRFAADADLRFGDILNPINVSQAQFFSNAVDTKTTGVDYSMKYRYTFGKNELNFSMLGNWTKTTIRQDKEGNKIIKTPQLLNGFEDIFFNREDVSRIEVAQPKSKIILSAIYKSRKMEAHIGVTRFGEVKYIHPEDEYLSNWVLNTYSNQIETRDQTFSSKWLTNINIKYSIFNNLKLTLGGSNIFDVFPDRHIHSANVSNGIFRYSRRVSQFGLRGAFWFVKVGVRL